MVEHRPCAMLAGGNRSAVSSTVPFHTRKHTHTTTAARFLLTVQQREKAYKYTTGSSVHTSCFFCNNQEAFVKHVVSHAMEVCGSDLEFFNKFYDKELLQRLQRIKDKPFVRVSLRKYVLP